MRGHGASKTGPLRPRPNWHPTAAKWELVGLALAFVTVTVVYSYGTPHGATSDAGQVSELWMKAVYVMTWAMLALQMLRLLTKRTAINEAVSIKFTRRRVLPVAIVAAYVVALPWVGFTASTLVVCTLLFRLLGMSTWIRATAVSVLFTSFLTVLFTLALYVPLPRGSGVFEEFSLSLTRLLVR